MSSHYMEPQGERWIINIEFWKELDILSYLQLPCMKYERKGYVFYKKLFENVVFVLPAQVMYPLVDREDVSVSSQIPMVGRKYMK